jgi:hypothetical protein
VAVPNASGRSNHTGLDSGGSPLLKIFLSRLDSTFSIVISVSLSPMSHEPAFGPDQSLRQLESKTVPAIEYNYFPRQLIISGVDEMGD